MALKDKKNKNFLNSFKNAFNGIINTFIEERNIKIHLVMAFLVILFAFILKISYYELLICLILIGLVISFELINTSIENAVDLCCKNINPLAKKAKDSSAGAVLFMSFISAIIGLIIFIPKFINFIGGLL